MEITRDKIELRLVELRQAQLDALAQASAILGRIDECELLLLVLAKEEEGEVETSPPSMPPPNPPPKLVEEADEDLAEDG